MKAFIITRKQGSLVLSRDKRERLSSGDLSDGWQVLDWILYSLSQAGISDFVYVGPEQVDRARSHSPHVRFHQYSKWPDGNLLESLFQAEPRFNGPLALSYSDIVFRPAVARRLMSVQEADIGLVVDRGWLERRGHQNTDELASVEKVAVRDGRIAEIGTQVPVHEAYGEFVGLAMFSDAAVTLIRQLYQAALSEQPESRSFIYADGHQPCLVDILQELIDAGLHTASVDIWGDWMAIRTPRDLDWARQQLAQYDDHGSPKEFWAVRAEGYDRLDWVHRPGYLDSFIAAGDFQPTDLVLDVGCGTGIVPQKLAPLVAKVVGVDISPEMLKRARQAVLTNCVFQEGLAQALHFPDNSFDKVTARMVFHHLIEEHDRAMQECCRVLKPGGRMLLSEGTPPHPTLRRWYADMFALKEERLTFLEEDLVALMEHAGFEVERIIRHVSPQVSIGNWLQQSGLAPELQRQIMQMHLDLAEDGKGYYRMTVTNDDVLCDFTFCTVVGRKAPLI